MLSKRTTLTLLNASLGVRGAQARRQFKESRKTFAAVTLQSLLRGA